MLLVDYEESLPGELLQTQKASLLVFFPLCILQTEVVCGWLFSPSLRDFRNILE